MITLRKQSENTDRGGRKRLGNQNRELAHRAGNQPPPHTSVSWSLPARRSWRDSLCMELPSVAVVQLLIMFDPLWPHGLQHPRLPCPSLSLGDCSNPCPLSQWCHPTIPVSQLFESGGQSIGTSASASVLLMNIQGWFPLGLTGLISLLFKDSQESSPAPQFERSNSSLFSLLYGFYSLGYTLDFAAKSTSFALPWRLGCCIDWNLEVPWTLYVTPLVLQEALSNLFSCVHRNLMFSHCSLERPSTVLGAYQIHLREEKYSGLSPLGSTTSTHFCWWRFRERCFSICVTLSRPAPPTRHNFLHPP